MTKVPLLDKLVVVEAVSGIIILEAIALVQGINGTALILAIGGICGLVGYKADDIIKLIKKE